MRFLRFAGFTIVRAWQGFWRNAMMSLAATATVVLMLVLLAALFIVISGLNAGLAFIESKVAVTAQLQDGTSGGERDALTTEILAMPGVASVEYVSPQDAMQRLREAYEATGRKLRAAMSWIGADGNVQAAPATPPAPRPAAEAA